MIFEDRDVDQGVGVQQDVAEFDVLIHQFPAAGILVVGPRAAHARPAPANGIACAHEFYVIAVENDDLFGRDASISETFGHGQRQGDVGPQSAAQDGVDLDGDPLVRSEEGCPGRLGVAQAG